jgi:hypothetical protein
MFNGKELQKDEKEFFTRLTLCRRIPFPFLVLQTKKNFASPPVRNVARYTSGYKVIAHTHTYIYMYIYIYLFIYLFTRRKEDVFYMAWSAPT